MKTIISLFLILIAFIGCSKIINPTTYTKCRDTRIVIQFDKERKVNTTLSIGLTLLSGFNDSLKIFSDDKLIKTGYFFSTFSNYLSGQIFLNNNIKQNKKIRIQEINNKFCIETFTSKYYDRIQISKWHDTLWVNFTNKILILE